MGDALAQAGAHLNAAATALEGAADETPADPAPLAVEVRHDAVDMEPAADAAKHISDNEVEIARIQAEAETERVSLTADSAEHLGRLTALEEQIAAHEGRLSSLEGRAHEHAQAERAPEAPRGPENAVEELESEAGEPPEAPEPAGEPAAPETRRRGLHFRRRA